MSDQKHSSFKGPLRGQLLFAIVFLAAAVFLLTQLPDQTKWVKRTKFFAQPRFWPSVSIIGMVLFGGLHLWKLPRKKFVTADYAEWKVWFFAIEWVLWFLAYVLLVPLIGYLPVTLAFMPLMSWRMGYRNKHMLWISAIFGLAVVVLFKSLLDVKIPGSAMYEYLPGALRSFFILNF